MPSESTRPNDGLYDTDDGQEDQKMPAKKTSKKHPRQEEQDDRKIPANDSETSDAEDFDNLESESDKSSIITIYTPTDKGVRLSQKSKKAKGKRRNYAFPEVINLVESDDNDDVDTDCYYSDTS